jgi:hypothetical protein
MRFHSLGVFVSVVVLPAWGQNNLIQPQTETRLGMERRLEILMWSIAGPVAITKTVAVAGLRHAADSPPEWGQGMAGYGRRVGYRHLRRTVNNSVEFGVGALIGEDPRYFRSNKLGFWGRVGHAASSAFVARVDGGGTRFAYARFAGAYGGAAIANAWYPERVRGPGYTLARGTYSIGGEIVGNLWREFWPDIKRKVFRR